MVYPILLKNVLEMEFSGSHATELFLNWNTYCKVKNDNNLFGGKVIEWGIVPKFQLKLKEDDVTVIAAMIIDGAVLMAADSQQTNVDDITGKSVLKQSAVKLERLTMFNIGFGFSGATDVGEDFRRWLHSHTFASGEDWIVFKEQACTELSRLNGIKHKNMRLADVEPKENDTTSVLIAGYLKAEPKLLTITSTGTANLISPFAVIGSGENHVRMAKYTLETYFATFPKKELKYDEALFRFIITVGVLQAPECSTPVQLLHLNPNL